VERTNISLGVYVGPVTKGASGAEPEILRPLTSSRSTDVSLSLIPLYGMLGFVAEAITIEFNQMNPQVQRVPESRTPRIKLFVSEFIALPRGNCNSSCKTHTYMSEWLSAQNGLYRKVKDVKELPEHVKQLTLPLSISYNIAPKLHQSTSYEYGSPCVISGATYSAVPQNVFVRSLLSPTPTPLVLHCSRPSLDIQ